MDPGIGAVIAALLTAMGGIIVWQQTRVREKDTLIAKSDEERRAELRADFATQLHQQREDCAARVAEKDKVIDTLWAVINKGDEAIDAGILVASASLRALKKKDE